MRTHCPVLAKGQRGNSSFVISVARDNAQNELAQLKIYASKEMHSFEETFKELDDLLEEGIPLTRLLHACASNCIQKTCQYPPRGGL